jgi:hypothetical protein
MGVAEDIRTMQGACIGTVGEVVAVFRKIGEREWPDIDAAQRSALKRLADALATMAPGDLAALSQVGASFARPLSGNVGRHFLIYPLDADGKALAGPTLIAELPEVK